MLEAIISQHELDVVIVANGQTRSVVICRHRLNQAFLEQILVQTIAAFVTQQFSHQIVCPSPHLIIVCRKEVIETKGITVFYAIHNQNFITRNQTDGIFSE